MSTKTTNYEFVKPEKTDPADITATNENWDKIDAELKDKLPKSGGELTNELIVNENFQVRKTFDEVPYRSYIRPINYSIASNGDYSTGLIHYKNGVTQAQLMFNKDGVILRDNVNGKTYQIYGQYNTDLLKNIFLPLTGGVLAGNLDFKKVDNGSATIYKNHSDTADYGLIIRDVAPNGNYSQLLLCANDNTLKYRDTAGKVSQLYGEHNKPKLSELVLKKTYTSSTNDNGNANTSLDKDKYIILNITAKDASGDENYLCNIYKTDAGGGRWYVNVTNVTSKANVKNTSFTFTIYYMAI